MKHNIQVGQTYKDTSAGFYVILEVPSRHYRHSATIKWLDDGEIAQRLLYVIGNDERL